MGKSWFAKWRAAIGFALSLAAGAEQAEILLASPDPAIPEVRLTLRTAETLIGAASVEGDLEAYVMTESDCIALALGQSRYVTIAEIAPLAAAEKSRIARGAFDPRLEGAVQESASSISESGQVNVAADSISALLFSGTEADIDATSVSAGVSGVLQTGTRYAVQYGRTDSTLDVNGPTRTADIDDRLFSVTLSQPLLRGWGLAVNRSEIRKGEIGEAIASAQEHQARQETVAAALKAFWRLAALEEELEVRQSAVATSTQLLEDVESLRELGAASDLDVLTAKSGLGRRQNDMLATAADLGAASDVLKSILDLRDGDHLVQARIVASPENPFLRDDAVQLERTMDERVAIALGRRAEPYIEEQLLESAEVDVRRARNGRLPQLDLFGRYTDGEHDEESPVYFVTDLHQDNDGWEVGLQASYPLGNRSARGAYRGARYAADVQAENVEVARTQVMQEIATALRNVRKSRVLLDNNLVTVELERARFEAEEARLDFGESTPFHVLQVQDEYIAEQTRLAVSRAAYYADAIELLRADGTLMDHIAPEDVWMRPEPAD